MCVLCLCVCVCVFVCVSVCVSVLCVLCMYVYVCVCMCVFEYVYVCMCVSAFCAVGGQKDSANLGGLQAPAWGIACPNGWTSNRLQPPVHGCIEVKGVPLHPSHSIVGYRGYFVCVHCGYVAASHVVKLKEPCGLVLSPARKTQLRQVVRGVLPARLSAWPDAAPRPSPMAVLL